jgi:hypothetical protein
MSVNLGPILQKHLQKAITNFSDNTDFVPIGDLTTWVARLRGLDGIDDCLKSAEILITYDTRVKFGEEKLSYPFNPPRFLILTPNGKYGHDGIVCIGIGEYHRDNYNQNLGIAGTNKLIIQSFIALDETGEGIRIQTNKPEKVKQISAESRGYNIKNHREKMILLEINYFALIASKLWKCDPENTDRLLEIGDEKLRTAFSKKLIGLMLSIDVNNLGISNSNANSSNSNANSSNSNANSSNSNVDLPSNLIDFVIQKIETITDKISDELKSHIEKRLKQFN